MCEVCTEAVHSLSESVFTISTTLTCFYGPAEIFRLHFSGALFADSTTLKLARAPYQPGAKNNNLQISSTMAIYAYPHASLEETRVLRFYNFFSTG